MRILLVHQNFPGQYRYLAPHLARQGHQVFAVGERRPQRQIRIPGVRYLAYDPPRGATPSTHHYLRGTEANIRRGQQVVRLALDIAKNGWAPRVICAHPGWGESLFLKDVFPRAKILNYYEFFYNAEGSDVGFEPGREPDIDTRCKLRVRNATQLMSFASGDWGISPTHWQQRQYPPMMRALISVIHDGVDTHAIRPDPKAVLELPDHQLRLTREDEVITYVARNLEPYRGFHIFMRALPEILRHRPRARVLIVGREGVSYGSPPKDGRTWRQVMMDEVGSDLDLNRVHFLGQVPYPTFLKLVQISSAHVYLTYPFVLSWSMLEAMACGALVIGSRTPPVEEVIEDGVNGLLVDFFDTRGLADRIDAALDDPGAMEPIRRRARETVVERYDLKRVCLPQQLALIETLGAS
ncbi:MAG TPA: glycosyltransferase [Sedimenticola sp.]|nr:glycosyltransferase [Sedimenticola sp.]